MHIGRCSVQLLLDHIRDSTARDTFDDGVEVEGRQRRIRGNNSRSLGFAVFPVLLMDKEPFCLAFALALIHFINYSTTAMPFSVCLRHFHASRRRIGAKDFFNIAHKRAKRKRTMPSVIKTNQNGYRANPCLQC